MNLAGATPYHDFPFALTFPSDAADGDYDMCVVGYNVVSGLQTARPIRVTLPESGWEFWHNNRPAQYNPQPTNDCSQHIGCRTGYASCSLPAPGRGICAREVLIPRPLVHARRVAFGRGAQVQSAERCVVFGLG